MDSHISYLQEVCRVGGRKFSTCKQSTRYSVEKCSEMLKSIRGIDISLDSPNIHPQYVCTLCMKALKRASATTKATHCRGGCGPPVEWEPHHRTNCSVCSSRNKGRGASAHCAKSKTTLRGAALHLDTNCEDSEANTPLPPTASICGMDIPVEEVHTHMHHNSTAHHCHLTREDS